MGRRALRAPLEDRSKEMSKRVTIVQASSDPRVLGRGALALARCLGLGVDAARRLIEGRTAIPAGLEDETAQQLAVALTAAGLPAQARTCAWGPNTTSAAAQRYSALGREKLADLARADLERREGGERQDASVAKGLDGDRRLAAEQLDELFVKERGHGARREQRVCLR